MRRRAALALGGVLLLAPGIVVPQNRVRRIGYLYPLGISETPTPERRAFLDGLREIGYEVGRNLVIEYRGADGDFARLPELAAELAKLPVEVIVVIGAEATEAAKGATRTVPVVVTAAGDPVYSGLIQSYARPGGNVTGLSFISPELAAKRIELVNELLPAAKRIAIVWNARDPISHREWDQAREAARKLALEIEPVPVRETSDLARALEALPRKRPDALLVIVDARMVGFRQIIAEAAIEARVPCIAGWSGYVASGALASYAPDFSALFRRAAYYVDRILRGANPAELPVEQPIRFELVVNLKTAKALGITVPRAVLVRADEVIQ